MDRCKGWHLHHEATNASVVAVSARVIDLVKMTRSGMTGSSAVTESVHAAVPDGVVALVKSLVQRLIGALVTYHFLHENRH